ncbi:MAG TPA: ergothioneine biosynthesis protein EgtB [Rhizomicrobium sp.]|jgi:ergothioneine biosynthesis protein EgtB|nr:ergothioneine biosynthesis protein EgtB [Rhizomicrobium sp.]
MAREAIRPAAAGFAADAPSALLADYAAVRRRTEALAAPLSAEDQNIQSMPDASPTKWHLAHTTWFFEAVLLAKFDPAYKPFDPAFNYLFNSYYEGLGPRHPRPQRGMLSRPSVEQILEYRLHVDEAMAGLIEARAHDIAPLLTLGLHHEQQHQELILTDILHAFSLNPLLPAYAPARLQAAREPFAQSWIDHAGGVVEIGHSGDGFAFDNESPRHQALLRPFRIAARPVSNGEFLRFVADGGYRRPEFWLSDGWAMVQRDHLNAPLYWLGDAAKGWQQYSLQGPHALEEHAPVAHLSFYEAAAYAAWVGARLPTEFEWEAASAALSGTGEVWEWTRSSYDPYPGYRPFEGEAAEYNGKFMSGQIVLRGGSVATPPGHGRATYRNFFPPSARWQFSGLRLASDTI